MNDLGIPEKIRTEMQKTPFAGILALGVDNIRYLTGAVFPFLHALPAGAAAVVWPREGEPVLVVPARLKDTVKYEGRIRNVQTWADLPGGLGEAVAGVAEGLGLRGARLGVTETRIPAALYASLKERLPEAAFASCDAWLSGLRMVKTPAEVELLEKAAFKADHGLAGAAHHVMVYAPRPEKGLSELIRVHSVEREMDMTGYESLAVGASGEHTAVPWPEAPFFGVGLGKQLGKNELVRMEMRASLEGYWADAARLLVMGLPSDEQARVYGQVNALRAKILGILKPGVVCADAARDILEFCTAEGIDLVPEHGLGHGLGVSPVERPFIDPTDDTVLAAGMVLVLTPTLRGPEGELVRSYDTVVITPAGARLTGWYKNWNEPYKAARSYQHGGG